MLAETEEGRPPRPWIRCRCRRSSEWGAGQFSLSCQCCFRMLRKNQWSFTEGRRFLQVRERAVEAGAGHPDLYPEDGREDGRDAGRTVQPTALGQRAPLSDPRHSGASNRGRGNRDPRVQRGEFHPLYWWRGELKGGSNTNYKKHVSQKDRHLTSRHLSRDSSTKSPSAGVCWVPWGP